MTALAWTYFPPTCWMTSAYSFSAPMATIVPLLPIAPASDAEQPASRLTARLTASGTTAALPLQPPGMARLPSCGPSDTGNDNDSQFWSQIGMKPGSGRVGPDDAHQETERALDLTMRTGRRNARWAEREAR